VVLAESTAASQLAEMEFWTPMSNATMETTTTWMGAILFADPSVETEFFKMGKSATMEPSTVTLLLMLAA